MYSGDDLVDNHTAEPIMSSPQLLGHNFDFEDIHNSNPKSQQQQLRFFNRFENKQVDDDGGFLNIQIAKPVILPANEKPKKRKRSKKAEYDCVIRAWRKYRNDLCLISVARDFNIPICWLTIKTLTLAQHLTSVKHAENCLKPKCL